MKNSFKNISVIFAFSLLFSSLSTVSAFANENDEQKYLKNISQLTFDGKKNGEAYFSPDGKKIIFQGIKKDDINYQIYTMNKDGSSVKMVSTGKGKTTCAYFSPDGKSIIYSSSHLKPDSEVVKEPKPGKRYEWDFEEGMDIFQAREDGSGMIRLTDAPGYDAEATYSPDGKKIIFTSNRDGDLELYVMNSDGSGQKRITNHPGYDGGAFFSPDGNKIVYRRFDRKGHAQIILANADGSEEKQLTNSEAINWCPYFHPDGKHIIFSSNMLNPRDFDLFITDLEGKNSKRITFDPASDVLPVFSPDGKQLLWTSTRTDKKSQIFLADFDLNEASELSSAARQIYDDIKYLAADRLEGRRSGSTGAEMAAEYIRSKFQQIGLLPGGEQKKKFFQSFQVSTGVTLGEKNSFKLAGQNISRDDFTPLSFSENGTVEGELVFAGYGISAAEYNYDDYDHLDVKDKVVIVLRHEPQETDSGSIFNGNKPTPYSEIRYKVFNAKRHGAKGLILLNGPVNYPDSEDQLLQVRSNEASGTAGLPAIQAKNKIFADLFSKKNYDLKEIQEKIDKNLKPYSFYLTDTLDFQVDLKRNFKETVNVIGLIEGSDPQLKNEMIVIGAHYDHLGFGGEESLSSSKQPEIHNGADDNASGVAGVIELARRLKASQPKRSIAFIAFSGEELGLLGSSYFTKNSSLENVVSMINLDMVGRLTENNLYVGGIKTAENFEDLINEINRDYGFKLSFFKDGYGPSDHMSFYLKNIPVLFFFTGVHNDYHKPSDDFYKVDVSGLERIVGMIEKATAKIAVQAEKPKLVKIEPPVNTSVSGKSYGAYLGTIPDYTSDMNSTGGVTLSGVKEGGPAQQAGLKSGDIIIRFDEIKINNLYDYTFALRTKKPGEKVNILVIRSGKEQVFVVELGKK